MTTPLQQAQAWVSSLGGMGVNIERARWLSDTYGGVPLYQSQAYFNHLAANGVAWIRGFLGTSPSNDPIQLGRAPVQSDLTPYFQGIQLAINAGIKVRFDFTDVIMVTDYTASGSTVPGWLGTASAYAASYGFTNPGMVCFGAFNEPFDDGAGGSLWNPQLVAAANILRGNLPIGTWTLSMQRNYWNSPQSNQYGSTVLAPDGNFIYDIHYYPFNQPTANGSAAVQSEWANVASEMASWSTANGNVPMLIGEAGLWNTNDQPYGGAGQPGPGDWPAAIHAMQAGAGQYRPAPWAIADAGDAGVTPLNEQTNGTYGTANGTGDVPTAVQTALSSASTAIKAASYYSNPTIVTQTVTVTNPGTLVGDSTGHNAPFTVHITTSPALSSIQIIPVHGTAPNYYFYSGPTGGYDTATLTGGSGTYSGTFQNTGDFLKYGTVGGPYVNTAPVTITAKATSGGGGTGGTGGSTGGTGGGTVVGTGGGVVVLPVTANNGGVGQNAGKPYIAPPATTIVIVTTKTPVAASSVSYRRVTTQNPSLHNLSLTYLGDATQAVRIAQLNNLTDFYQQSGQVTLLLPNIDTTQTGGVPQQ